MNCNVLRGGTGFKPGLYYVTGIIKELGIIIPLFMAFPVEADAVAIANCSRCSGFLKPGSRYLRGPGFVDMSLVFRGGWKL